MSYDLHQYTYMPVHEWKILTTTDTECLANLEKSVRPFEEDPSSVAKLTLNAGGFSVFDGRLRDVDKAVFAVNGSSSRLLSELQVNFTHKGKPVEFRIRQQGPEAANIARLQIGDGMPPTESWALYKSFANQFPAYTQSEALKQFAPNLAEYYEKQEQLSLDLKQLSRNITEDTLELRRKMYEEEQEREKRRDADLERARERNQQKYDAKFAELEAKQKELEEKARKLDLRSNTDARRSHQKELKQIFQLRSEKFALTKNTEDKRQTAGMAFLILFLVTFGLTVFSGWRMDNSDWTTRIPFMGSAATLIGSLVFLIRWQNRWADLHAKEEFRLKRLELDVDRASWLVEWFLEWKVAEGGDLPPELLSHLAHGLFQEENAPEPDLKHPTQDLLSFLLGSATNLKVSIPPFEATMNRNDQKRIKKQLDRQQQGS